MVTTRASQFAGRLMEVGWLTALIVVPVFFNVWSDRVFEPDKLTLLRSIALVMVAAAAVWFLERGRPEPGALRRWLTTPVVGPVLLLSAMYVLASLLSVDAHASWMGGHNRMQGTYTWCAYLVLFLAIIALLRDRFQLDRLLFAVVLPSLPVGLYGILQKLSSPERRLDPMPWLGDTSKRVASTMGNSIFVAAYLILTVPITLVLLVRAMRDLDEDESNTAVIRVSAYLVLLAMQLTTIVLSQSRGPWIGLAGGLFFLVLLMAAWRGRRAMLAILGVGAVLAVFVVLFNVPNSPLAPLRKVPYLGRLGQVFETESGTGKVRVLIWRGAAELVTSDPARMVVGYGPESMSVAYNKFYQPELAHYESRNASPDRSHNETFDVLVNTGLLGFLAYLAMFTTLFYYGLKWLGFIEGAGQRAQFMLMWLGGGILAAVAFYFRSHDLTYFGVALSLGMVAGLFGYVVLRTLRGWSAPRRPGALLLAGLMGAIIAHFIEINLGIAIASTRTVFFVLAAAMVVVGALSAERPALLTGEPEPELAPSPTPNGPAVRKKSASAKRSEARAARRPGTSWLSHAFMVMTLLATLIYTFIVDPSPATFTAIAVLAWLFLLAWGLGTLALLTEAELRARRDPGAPRPALVPYVIVTGVGFVVYLTIHWVILGAAMNPAKASADPFAGASTSSTLFILFNIVLLALMLGWAAVLTRDDPAPGETFRGRLYWLYPVFGLVVVAVAFTTNVNVVRADIYYKQAYVNFHTRALDAVDKGDIETANAYFDLALQHYDKALALNPGEDYYLLFRGKALLEQADSKAQALEPKLNALKQGAASFSEYSLNQADVTTQVKARDDAFEAALRALEMARAAAPLNTDHTANLGRAYKFWGDRTMDPAKRTERFDQSVHFYEEAIAQSPANAGLLEELATTQYLAGNVVAATKRISDSLVVDPEFTRPLRLRATIRRDNKQWAAAAADYQTWVNSKDGRSDAVGWSGLALVLGQLKRYDEAMAANGQVLKLAPGDTSTLHNLVVLAQDSGDRAKACQYVAEALQARPNDTETLKTAGTLGCQSAPDSAPPSGAVPGTVAPGGGSP